MLLGGAAGLAWLRFLYPRSAAAGAGREVEIKIAPGKTLESVVEELEREHMVAQPAFFRAYMQLRGADKALRQGRFRVSDDLRPGELARRLARNLGPSWVRVTVPEGWHRFAIAEKLEAWGVCPKEEFLRVAARSAPPVRLRKPRVGVEGYLFPDTYEFRVESSAREVLKKMLDQWRAKTMRLLETYPAQLAQRQRELGWGLDEVVTLASIVEKESALAEERPVIAGVFLNRLRSPRFRPKRLQADPTVSYGCIASGESIPSCKGFRGTITKAMLADKSNPFNTYQIEGLPPAPIANPGLASLRAVLMPQNHEYFYFVARGNRAHRFSKTLGDHNRAVSPLRGR